LIAENLGKYWHYCRMYGVRSATLLAIRRLRKPRGSPPITVNPLARLPEQPTAVPSSLSGKTVSIVIPTKNAGDDLGLLIRKLRNQEGVPQPEIIVVDSGSTDNTLEIAAREKVKVVHIAPEEFTHSYSRNRGAESAGGEYLLFMVQDALPLTARWLGEMVAALESNNLAAVSCAEYPRSGSDLFYQFLIHDQGERPGLEQDRIMAWDTSCNSYLGLRSNAQLSDITALLRRDVFQSYRYRVDYAEDLDLGIRLIRDGHRLGFLHSTRVLHSHNRPASYFLKRGYVDVRFLVEVFPNFLYPEIAHAGRLYSDICSLHNRICALRQKASALEFPAPLANIFALSCATLAGRDATEPRLASRHDPALDAFLNKLEAGAGASRVVERSMIMPHVMKHFNRFQSWTSEVYDQADESLCNEILSAVEKIFALHAGNHLAYLYLTSLKRREMNLSLVEIDKTLVAGV